MNKKQIITLIEALKENAYDCAIISKELGNEKMYEEQLRESLAYDRVICILKSPKYAKETADIFGLAY